jgi:hypothetical protein
VLLARRAAARARLGSYAGAAEDAAAAAALRRAAGQHAAADALAADAVAMVRLQLQPGEDSAMPAAPPACEA